MKTFMRKQSLFAKSKKFLALLLAVAMVTGNLPATTAYAAESNSDVAAEADGFDAVDSTVVGETSGSTDGSEVGEPAEIVIGSLSGFNGSNGNTVKEVNGQWIVSRQYDEASRNPFESMIGDFKDVAKSYVTVETADNSNDTNLKNQLKFQWQKKGADGAYADMAAGAVPSDAGEYKLVISIDKKFAVAESVSVDFVIEKKELYVTYNSVLFSEVMDSGNTVKEIKDSLAEAWGLSATAGGELVERYKAFVNEPTISVKESMGTEELADDTMLMLGKDYSVWISVSVKEAYQANYEIIQRDMINLRIVDLVYTWVEITNNRLGDGEDLVRNYKAGEAVASPTTDGEDAEITVKVFSEEIDPVTGENIEIIPAEGALNFFWEDANGNLLENAPADAGAYYYKAVYTDAQGVYASSSEKIRVVVEPAELVVRPVFSREGDIFVGTSASELLLDVSYELYHVAANGAATEKYEGWDKNTFWGVSYNNPEKPESYSPVFKLQMGQTTSKKVGDKVETTTVWYDVNGVDYYTGVNLINDEEVTISYRIVFTGKKGLYESGKATSEIDVNTVVNLTDTNYRVDTSVMEADENVVVLTVKESANAVIDVNAMLIDGKGDSINNIYTKIYDGISLYGDITKGDADKSAYKKAVVKDATTGAEIGVSGTDAALSYTWYTYTIEDKVDKKTGEVVLDDAGNPVKEAVLGYKFVPEYDNLPKDAGMYCLKVSFYDATHKYAAEPAYVYFDIEKQLVYSVVSGTPVVYSGTAVSDFGINCGSMMEHKLYLVPGNDRTLALENMQELTELEAWNKENPSDPVYTLNWRVLVGDSTDPAVAKFEDIMSTSSSVKFDAKLLYKAGAKVKFNYVAEYADYYYNFTNNYEVVEEDQTVTESFYNTVDVTVKQMGDIELELRVDESKRGVYEKVYDGTGFDITEAVKAGYITLVKENTDEIVPIIGENALDVQFLWYYWDSYINGNVYDTGLVSPAYASAEGKSYMLYISFGGDETYKNFSYYVGDGWVIDKRDVIITPAVRESIVAGINVAEDDLFDSVVDLSKTTVSGYIEADAAAFGNGILENAGVVFSDVNTTVYTNKTGAQYNSYLRTGVGYAVEVGATYRTYSSRAEDYVLWSLYRNNYNLVLMQTAFTPNTRANSTVKEANTYYNAEYAANAVTVTPLTAVPYWKNAVSYGGTMAPDGNIAKSVQLPEGNYFEIVIEAPEEFKAEGYASNAARFVYKNAVEAAGGYLMAVDDANGLITVAFPANDKKDKSFTILWEEGYTETYTLCLSNAELMVDVTLAVAPKGLSFNGVNKKMIVGETQHLDVKINRVLPTDVVLLNYGVVSGADVVSVDKETGVVTALKTGNASIEVYPVRLNQNGEYERITSFKKKVVVKIKVNQVSAPKISSVRSTDTTVRFAYKVPADGYRREVYILPGKGLKAAAFDELIKANDNLGFAGWDYVVEGKYSEDYDYYEEDDYYYDTAKGVMYWTFYGLKPNTDYTVYVRNVSAIRETADGSEVVKSASGSVKSFKTTKRQVEEVHLQLLDESYQKGVWNEATEEFDVPLSAKTLKIETLLGYPHKDSQAAADSSDMLWLTYPIAKKDQATYLNPKMEYFIIDDLDDYEFEKTGLYKYYVDGVYYKASKLATIDKKGNIKLKGVGDIYVCARDTVSGESDVLNFYNEDGYERYAIHIYADVTKMTAKKVNLKTGMAVDIYSNLVFYNGKSKLNGVAGLRDQNPLVVTVSDEEAVEYKNGYLCALEPNKTVTVTVALRDNPTVTTTMQVKTKAMDAVKAMKVHDVDDFSAWVTFTHTGNAWRYGFEAAAQYKVTLKDNRGSIIGSYVADADNADSELYRLDKSNYEKNQYVYDLDLYYLIDENGKHVSLTHLTNYTVSITPLFRDELGKAVTKKFKTTNTPAGYGDYGKNGYGGLSIATTNGYDLEDVYFISGNTYTLDAYSYSNKFITSMSRMSDKLTWRSTNKKVASIKANAGTYSATLKALKPGVTDIEIVSKVTKKVIARRTLVVIPVGNGVGSYGTLEPIDYDAIMQQNGVELLTLENPVRIQKAYSDRLSRYFRDDYFVSFTAPFDGEYSFTKNVADGYVRFREDYTLAGKEYHDFAADGQTVAMKQGETIELGLTSYWSDSNGGRCWSDYGVDFTVSVSAVKSYNKLMLGGSVNSVETPYVRFVAPKDNYYTFYATKPDMTAAVSVDGASKGSINLYNEQNADGYKSNNGVGLKKGQVVTLTLNRNTSDYDVSVKGREVTTLSGTAVSTGDLKNGEEKWYVYTAPVAGNYTFASKNATGMMKADNYVSICDAASNFTLTQVESEGVDTNDFSHEYRLNKGDEVVIRVYPEIAKAEGETDEQVAAKTAKADISVSQPIVKTVSLTATQTVEIAKYGEAWVAFEVPEDDTEYCFNFAIPNDKSYKVTARYYINDITNVYEEFASSDNKVSGLKKGDILYIRLTTDAEETASVVVSVKATRATELTVGKASTLKVSDDGLYFYTFKAPSYGLYTIQSQVTVGENGNHKLRAYEYSAVNSDSRQGSLGELNGADFYEERMFVTGEEIIFAVEPSDAFEGETTASILVSKIEPESFTEQEITLQAGESKWYRYTATSDDNYIFSWNDTTAANVAYSATWKADIGGSVASGISQEMLTGSSIYFKVSNNTVAETKIQFKVTSATPMLPNTAFAVKADATQSYKYVVTKEGRYKVTATAAEDGVNVLVNGTDCTKGVEYYYYAGQTVVYNVTADAEATVTVKVELIVPATLTDAAVALKAGESKWFEFVVPATGRYSVDWTDAEGNATSAYAYFVQDSIKEDALDYVEWLDESWFVKGDVYYIKLYNGTNDELSTKLAIKQIVMTDLPVSADLTTISLNSGEEKWYRFRADETTYYTFTVELAENMSAVYYWNTSGYDYTLTSDTVGFRKNGWYDIKVSRNSGDGDGAKEAKLGVVKEPVTTIKEKTDCTISAKNNEMKYLKFDVSSTGYYSIIAKDVPEGVTLKLISDDGTVTYTEDSRYSYRKYTVGTTVNYEMYLQFDSDDAEATKEVKLYIEKIVPAEMENSLEVSVEKGLRSWFVFTAPEDGRYTFTDDSEVAEIRYYAYMNQISYSYSYHIEMPRELVLSKGQQVYMAAYYNTAKGDAEVPANTKFKVTAKKVEPKAITGTVFKQELAPNSVNWYAYTANELNQYTFTFEETEGTSDGEDGNSYTVRSYGDILDDYYSTTSAIKSVMMAGDVRYFRVENTTDEKKNFRVKIDTPAKEALKVGEAKEVTFAEDGIKMLTGTVSESAFYYLEKKAGTSPVDSVKIYYGNTSLATSSDVSVFYLEEGEEFGVMVTGAAESSVTITVAKVETISADTDNVITLTEDGTKYVQCKSNGLGGIYLSRKDGATAYSSVTFRYTDNSAYRTLSSGSSSSLGSSRRGQYVLIRLTGYTNSTTTIKLYSKYADKGSISVGSSVYVEVPSNFGQMYTFTAPTSGTYQFYSTGSQDSDAYLYDMDGNMITSDDDGGEGSNFLMEYEMDAGETVYCCVRKWGWYSGSFTLHVEKVN